MATLTGTGPDVTKLDEYQLYEIGKKLKDVERPGKLHIEVVSSDDLTSL